MVKITLWQIMIHLWFLLWICFNLCCGLQFYDPSFCSTDGYQRGTRYTCRYFPSTCGTFLVYRANEKFQTIANISTLFNMVPDDDLLSMNNVTSSFEMLKPGREVLLPVTCSCSGDFFQADVNYVVQGSITIPDIACGYFEGLVKAITLAESNNSTKIDPQAGTKLSVPLKCACPDKFSGSAEVKYLVTYPVIGGDTINILSKKFGVASDEVCAANNLNPLVPTVHPNTTVLVPLKGRPSINFSAESDSEPPGPGFIPTVPVEKSTRSTHIKNLSVAGSVVGLILLVITCILSGIFGKALNKCKAESSYSVTRKASLSSDSASRSYPISVPTTRNSTNSCLSPDLLNGIKYCLCNYSVEELKKATKNFSKDSKISDNVYKGVIDNVELLIRELRFEDTSQVIDVHSKINHVNILKLHGVCYDKNDVSPSSYLVFEFPSNGCLRDCLTASSVSLGWKRRTQIAFDIATGLHYLHYCIVPPYTHASITSKSIFLTSTWRAKLAVCRTMPTVEASSAEHSSFKGRIAPDDQVPGSMLEKVDNFAFGMVLLEIISGKADREGKLLAESITFLGGSANEGGCFEQLKNFVDPSLKEDYTLAEALCLAVLAKACVEDDPLHRPSMDDILKVLARMV